MIRLNRLNGTEVVINPDFIEMMEETPDLLITMVSGKKFVLCQTMNQALDKIMEYRCQANMFTPKLNVNCVK